MELQDYVRTLRRQWVTVAVVVAVCLGFAALVIVRSEPQYQARTELFVAARAGSTSQELVQGSDFLLDRVKSYALVIDSEIVLRPVIDELELDTSVGALAGRVSAQAPTDTVVLVVTVRDGSAERAAATANAVAERFQEVATDLEPQQNGDQPTVEVTIVHPATTPSAPVSPNKRLIIALGLVLGLALGFGAALLRQLSDKRIRRDSDVHGLTDVPIIGYIPQESNPSNHGVLVGQAIHGTRAEAFRQLRTNFQFLNLAKDRCSYVVTSSLPDEGKTITGINLALMLADAGLHVCFVEADLRQPHATRYLGLERGVGLTDILAGSAKHGDAVHLWKDTSLDVLGSGHLPPNPSELLGSKAMLALIRDLEEHYDTVLIDAPPLLAVTDAAILARNSGGAIVVVSTGGRTAVTSSQLSRTLADLESVDARIAGIVLNRIPTKGPDAHAMASYSYLTTEP